jgi:hypothetical protein
VKSKRSKLHQSSTLRLHFGPDQRLPLMPPLFHLSESLAQYSALMVMEKQYDRDIMRKSLHCNIVISFFLANIFLSISPEPR